MPLDNRKKGLCELLKARRSMPKDASGFQPPFPPPPPPSSVNPVSPTNLNKRKKEKEVVEEGELVPQKVGVPPKQQKTAKGKGWVFSVESKKDQNVAKVCLQNPKWDPRLELDGAAIPLNSAIREF